MGLSRPPTELNEALLLEKCSDFARFQIWPLRARLDPKAWLDNFDPNDRPLAGHLLNAFMYFSDDITRQLFIAGLQSISVLPAWKNRRAGDPLNEWAPFLNSAVFTYVTGETPSPADSGHLFVRKARDYAGIPESRIVSPEKALELLIATAPDAPIIFVDDFVGSGNQFVETWQRPYDLNGAYHSFQMVAHSRRQAGDPLEVYYAPAVCTQFGRRHMATSCPDVQVSAGNVLDERYNVFHSKSLVWPESLVADGQELVRRQSRDLGLPDDGTEWGLYGFNKLGLAVGFAHKTPDATIPLFRFRSDNWSPLVKDV